MVQLFLFLSLFPFFLFSFFPFVSFLPFFLFFFLFSFFLFFFLFSIFFFSFFLFFFSFFPFLLRFMRPQTPNASRVVFVLLCCSCWRLACFLLTALAGFSVFFFLVPMFCFWRSRQLKSCVKEYLEHLHPNCLLHVAMHTSSQTIHVMQSRRPSIAVWHTDHLPTSHHEILGKVARRASERQRLFGDGGVQGKGAGWHGDGLPNGVGPHGTRLLRRAVAGFSRPLADCETVLS